MKYPIDTYRAFGDKCADAHYGKETARATDLFSVLWSCLGEETAPDHGVARDVFNGAFRSAYLSRWRPDAMPAPAPRYSDVLQRTHDTPFAGKVSRKSVALDCAAFFTAKQGA